jgi:phytoene synthase
MSTAASARKFVWTAERGPGTTAAYAWANRFAWRRGGNFNAAFWLLPRAQREAMTVLYAFFRYSDDLVDGAEPALEKCQRLDRWRREVEAAVLLGQPRSPILLALADVIRRFAISPIWLLEFLDGLAQDTKPVRFQTWNDLEQYCHRVASVVGFSALCVWECSHEDARSPAEAAGQAFQLTNILRDLREDLQNGRVYLPEELWQPLGASLDDVKDGFPSDAWLQAARMASEQAERQFRHAEALEAYLPPQAIGIWHAMYRTYRSILIDLRHQNFKSGAGRLSWARRFRFLCEALVRQWRARWLIV